MERRRLPIGIQSFSRLRETNSYYVDKTALIHKLVNEGDFYFLSRPRRFGKSLLLDTISELFQGNEDLFQGLAIHDQWDWEDAHPVVRLSFGGKFNQPGDLENDIHEQLALLEKDEGFTPTSANSTDSARLRALLNELHGKTGKRVVVLVDEYDKPILDVLDDPEMAKANRDHLRGLYGVIKDCANHVRFVFITGISMFSKVSLFSGLNNLQNISLDPRYASLCGYTDQDLDDVFEPELQELDRAEIRRWYNGYNWLGDEKVYNPFDILLLFSTRQFKAHWFETGTPEFLIRVMMEQLVSPLDLENRIVEEDVVSKFDVGDIGADALLFQTGYLTITGEEQDGSDNYYRLSFPNEEVRVSLRSSLINHISSRGANAREQRSELMSLLVANDFEAFADRVRMLFAGMPYHWHIKAQLSRYEAWFAGMMYAFLQASGRDVRLEEPTSRGRSDMVVLSGEQVFVLEFKMAKEGEITANALERAMSQMRERDYAGKYRGRGEPIHLLALVFGHEQRNLLELRSESA